MKWPWRKSGAAVANVAAAGRDVPRSGAAGKMANLGRAIRSSTIHPRDAELLRSINGRMLRSYEAALSSNLNGDFPGTISSANAEIFSSIQTTRARARTLDRDNPYAWAMLESMRVNVGGSEPFRLEMKVGKRTPEGEFIEERDTNEMVQEKWRIAGMPKNCTARRDMSRLELDMQAISSMVREGGYLARHVKLFPKNRFRYAIWPQEIDRLDHWWQGVNPATGNRIKMSIEVDEYDGPVGYWLLTRHPGEIFQMANLSRPYREFVPAEEMIALFDLRTRAEQLVGITRFASIIQPLHRGQQFDIAHVTAAIWSACKPLFILNKMPTVLESVPESMKRYFEALMASQDGENAEDCATPTSAVEPGQTEELEWGKEPFLVDPKFPIEAATNFKKDHLRQACAGSGTVYHHIAQDLENVNFSSGRLGENAFHDSCKILQNHFIESFRRPHFEAWLEYAILSGELKLPMSRYQEFCEAAHFHGRRWPYVNPLQDVQADILSINAGLDSRDHVIQNSERGGDVEKVNAEIAAGKRSDKTHKLDFSGASENKPTKPSAKADGEDPEDPEEGAAPVPKK